MTVERATKVEEIFEAVVDRPKTEQRDLLETACAGDSTLITEVLLLLEADAAGGHPSLWRDMGELAGNLLSETDHRFSTSRRFGQYRILELLGQGGMGRVYLAERRNLGDRVALKLLEDAWSSTERRERFAREQRMLAQLNHPHIARLYDAGVEDGIPWFAMEYVKGVPITTYCQENQLGATERLKLFRGACEAVAYAHRNLTVHLDLKPSNILVNEEGAVKLLDFGIARSLDREGHEAEKTKTGHRLFSLNYAAPEQIRGELLDVQTDIHGLGIILYELATGKTPVDLSRASATELFRYADQEVQRPSEAARANQAGSIQVSAADWADLDVLCLTALHRDRSRRYGTVEALVRDLDHFLKHEPLEAQTDNLRYRVGKFAKRNRRQVVAAVAAVALVAALSIVFTIWLIAARDRALSSEARTERIHQLMLNLFEGDDRAAGPAKGLRVIDLLDRGVQEAESRNREPELQAQLRYTLGTLYHKLGRLDRGEPLLRSALKEQARYLGKENPDTTKSQLALALLLKDESKMQEAENLVRDAVQRQERKYGSSSVEAATARAALGSILEARGDIQGALPLLEGAEKVLREGPENAELSQVLSDLADTYYQRGDIQLAEATRRTALALDRRLFGANHPSVAADLNNLGDMAMDRANYGVAEALYRQALAIDQAWYGFAHQKTGENLTGLATAMLEQKRYDQAAATFDRALAAIKASDGEQSFRFAAVSGLVGDMARVRNQLDRAGKLYDQSAEIFRKVIGEQNQYYAAELSGSGAIHVLKGEYREAEVILRKALGILQAVVPAERYTGLTQLRLAAALAGQKRYAEAEREGLAAYATLQKKTGTNSVEQKSARKELFEIYTAMNEPAKANQFR